MYCHEPVLNIATFSALIIYNIFPYVKMCLGLANCTFKSTDHQLWKHTSSARGAVPKCRWNLSDASPAYTTVKSNRIFVS